MRPSIDQTVLFTYTDDLERSSKFFTETLELDMVVDQGQCQIFKFTDTSYIGVCDLPGRERGGTSTMITIVTNEVDEWFEFLTAKGMVYQREPVDRPEFGIYASIFRSPDGYDIEIQSFHDPEWMTPLNQQVSDN